MPRRNDWVPDEAVAKELMRQASAIAARLGHRIEAWNHFGDHHIALCLNCVERVYVVPRRLGELGMHGIPVTLRCVPRRGR